MSQKRQTPNNGALTVTLAHYKGVITLTIAHSKGVLTLPLV